MIMWAFPVLGCALLASALLLRRRPLTALAVMLCGAVVIQALAPLFRGRVFTFMMENRNASADDVENNIEALCLEFERLKPYLLQLWKSRE